MMKSGHIGLNAVLSLPLCILTFEMYGKNTALLFLVPCVLFSTMPDADQKLARTIKIQEMYSVIPTIRFNHRGLSHSIYSSIVIGLILAMTWYILVGFKLSEQIFVIFSSGFLSVTFHVFGDIFTPSGVNYFQPVGGKQKIGWFAYDNLIANFTSYVIGFISIIIALSYLFGIIPKTVVLISMFLIYFSLYKCLVYSSKTELRYSNIS